MWSFKNLNHLIENYHSKISYFVEKIKLYTINQFNSTLKDLVIEDNKNLNNVNIYNDILNFTKKIYRKYRNPISLTLLQQLEKEDNLKLNEISLNILNEVFYFNKGENLNLDDEFDNKEEERKSDEEFSSEDESGEIAEDNKYNM